MEGFQSDSSEPYVRIGSKLRLLSQLKVRYEGTLYSVDTVRSTISLKNVKTFGTEGRGIDGNEVPGSDEIFEIIVFRAADISEIFMIEAPNAVSVDPAIVDYQQTREKQNASNTVPGGPNVTSGPESVQSSDVHHVPRHDVGHVGGKSVGGKWGSEDHRGNERESGWGPSQRSGHFDRRPPDNRRDREGFGERNGPYSAVDRKMPINNGNARPFQNQHGRNAGYGYDGSRQASARHYGGPQGGYHDHDHRYRGENGSGRVGWRDHRGRGFYNRDGGDDRYQTVPQHRRFMNARDGMQQSHRGRGQPRRNNGGHRSRDRENQRDRDLQSKETKNAPDFDFEKANEEFSKLDLNQAAASGEKEVEGGNGSESENREGATDSTEPTYQKDSFFDEISRDSRQSQRPKTSERSLNMQTFGAAASRRRPATGRYYNRRPGNWTGSSGANGGEAATNGTAQVSA